MAKYTVLSPSGRGELESELKPLGRGGEGSVYSVANHSHTGLPSPETLVVKIYAEPEEGNRREKVIAMVNSKPSSESLAWPLAVVFEGKEFRGYVMKKLDNDHLRPWADMAHSATRRDSAPDFGVNYAVVACINLARAIGSVHRSGHYLGDINESNAFVGSDSSVVIVDTDSAQITATDGVVYPCTVGKPEFTAPELMDKPFRDSRRDSASDAFAFGVMAYQMITGGTHPTAGIAPDDGPHRADGRIRASIYPTLRNESSKGFGTPPHAPIAGVPTVFRQLMIDIFLSPPAQRPSFETIESTLLDLQSNLMKCQQVSTHWYDRRDKICGWCVSIKQISTDPWGEKIVEDKSAILLPPVAFNQQKATPAKAPRAAVANTSGRPIPPPPSPQYNSAGHQLVLPSSGGALPSVAAPGLSGSGQIPNYGHNFPGNIPSPQAAPAGPPEKFKGKMTVIYPNGSWSPRPSMSVLAAHNPKLFWRALFIEWPDIFRPWWPARRDPAQIFTLLFGFIVGLFTLAAVLYFGSPQLEKIAGSEYEPIAYLFIMSASLTSLAALIGMLLSGIVRSIQARRLGYSIDNRQYENAVKVSLRFMVNAVAYLFTLPLVLIMLLMSLISRLGK